MAKRKSYDDKFRASAVVMLEAAGYPDKTGALQQVANNLSVPARTLSRWFNGEQNPPPDQVVSEKREELTTLLRNEIYAAVGEMPNARGEANYKDLITAVGILVDKLQLLEGKPTDRTAIEHSGGIALTHDDRLQRINKLLDTARSRRDGRASEDGELIQ